MHIIRCTICSRNRGDRIQRGKQTDQTEEKAQGICEILARREDGEPTTQAPNKGYEYARVRQKKQKKKKKKKKQKTKTKH